MGFWKGPEDIAEMTGRSSQSGLIVWEIAKALHDRG